MSYLFGLLLLSSVSSAAQPIDAYCDINAASFVEKLYADDYDREGFYGASCKATTDGRAVVCIVGASKGNGAAMDTFQVIMNSDCSEAYQIDLIGEE